jgi:glycosyltransferase involved in cell wall biosynthesis
MRRLLAVCAVDEPGGAEIGLSRLARRLEQRGWDVTVTTPHGDPSLAVGGLGRGQGMRALLSWPRARRLARGADVVYLNGGVPGRLLPALRGSRTVLHVHDLVERVPRFWRHADVVLADSQAVAERLSGLDAHVVGCPVELDPPVVAAPWDNGGQPVVGFVGRIEPRKGPLTLVQAAPAISARVVVVGDDPYGSDPAHLAAVRASTAVEHYGWAAEGAGLMRHLDVLVVPSVQEPFGTVAAEAMAVGTPVVAAATGGLVDVVEDGKTGRLFPPGDAEALSDAVNEVLARREEMGAAARERAQRYGADAYADRVENLIVGGRSGETG